MSETHDAETVLVLAPSEADARIACEVLGEHGIGAARCASVHGLAEHLPAQAGAAVVSEELLDADAIRVLAEALADQPAWSDFPLLVASRRRRGGADSAAHLAPLGNVTLLDSPLRLRTLVQAVRAALRARRRQYDARRAIERRDQFLAMLGHELRNPLSSIALASEHIEHDHEAPSRPVTILRRQTRQLGRIVDDLLDVARISTGKLVLDRQPLELAHALGQWVESFRPKFEAAGVTLGLSITAAAPVEGDPARLEQAFGNLLANCLKYTPAGGSVDVRLSREDDHARVDVVDTGVGIAPEMLSQIFDQFVQIEGSLDRAQGGMGVGLTLVQTLIELHGGSVEAHSEGLDRGSHFAVRLPVAARDTAPHEPAAARGTEPAWTMVVVEDNEDVREMLKMALERRGQHILEASDGPSGVEMIVAQRPDAAVIDIGLPGMDGYAVARAVREAIGDAVVLLAATGYGQAEDKRSALNAGFDVHLTKPARPDDILAQVERVLSGSSAASRRGPE